ncbi:YceI family protein [Schleiferiaceae bacterium]|jgi:polyisoprenoid-binding protein YceI|nr:YceI family protein [Schleiferiaceae bacterium]MDA9278960.1 YceI family protein [Schleiferiaceae bacterium]MDB4123697.1 YceI family protein [Schleiferiaceae bacterium]MDB4176613.1 YceI family protein [Schleiferiaceae bacterium]MDB9837663.1 YceI family protein [Schleiferiaceae bacterium]
MKKIAILAAVAIAAISCSNGSKADEAVTGDAQEVQAVVEATEYTVAEGSYLKWRGFKTYVASEHIGTIGVQSGTFAMAGDQLVGGKITIDMNSIANVDIEDEGKRGYLEGHLKSQDFFFVESFPTAVFEVVEVREEAADATPYVVVGNLTIRGITNSIEFPANVFVEEGSVRLEAPAFSIDRTKWDVKFHDSDDATIAETLKEDLIDHSIELTINVVATNA